MKLFTRKKDKATSSKATESMLHNIINNLNQAFIMIDKESEILFVNQKALEMSVKLFGFSIETGQYLWNLVSPEYAHKAKPIFEKAFSGKTFRIAHNFQDVENNEQWFEYIFNPVVDTNGNISGVVINSIDISELKKTERSLLESKAKYKAIVQDQTELISRYYPDGTITFANNAYCNFFEKKSNQIIGQNFFSLMPGETSEAAKKSIENLTKKNPTNSYTQEVLDENGNKLWIAGTQRAIFDADGNILEIQSVAKDITAQKRAEQELIYAKEKAEESDRLKSVFLTNISHEIRTPMNAVMGFSELLTFPRLDKKDRDCYISHILSNSQKLLSIINDVIEISEIETKQLPVNKTEFKLVPALSNIQSLFNGLASINGIELVLDYPAECHNLVINSDEHKLKQILSNLLSNAVKFSQSCNVDFGFTIQDPNIVFFVKDKGIGIPAEFHELIFDRFRQVDERLHRKYGGAGLGLSISRSLTELLGGKIWLESEPDKGSDFYFSIPFEAVEEMRAVEAFINSIEELDHNCWGNKKILIAEDEKINYIILREVLKRTGAKVMHATNGEDAIKKTHASLPDLILMDIRMPVLGGIDATKIIRSHYPDLPIIGITAYTYAHDREKAVRAGCNEYITKPIDKDKLLNTINKYLSVKVPAINLTSRDNSSLIN